MWLLWFQTEVATAVTLFFLPTWLISYNTHSSPSLGCSLDPEPLLDNQHWSRKEHFIPQKTWDVALKWNLEFKIIVARAGAILEHMTDGNYITCNHCGNEWWFLHCGYKQQKILLPCEPRKHGSCSNYCLLAKMRVCHQLYWNILIMLWWESEQSIYFAGQRATNVEVQYSLACM